MQNGLPPLMVGQPLNGRKRNQMITEWFIEEVWELAFGDNAIGRDFSETEVLDKLTEYERKALAWDTMLEDHSCQTCEDDEDTEEKWELREMMGTYLERIENE